MNIEGWEGVYLLPDACPPECSWCCRAGEEYSVVLVQLDLPAYPREVQAELVCSRCALGARAYIGLRKSGLSRREALRDCGFRA